LVQSTLQFASLPVIVSIVQGSVSSQVVGQSPSQVSPGSTTPLPQKGEQSLSVAVVHPAGQHPSPSLHSVIGWNVQVTLQLSGDPVIMSIVQLLPSLHSVGQLPSQVSPPSMTPLPQLGEQSLSFSLLHPAGQQPSPLLHAVRGV